MDSGSWWWTGRPGVLRFMGSQRVGHDWATELNWTKWPLEIKLTATLLSKITAEKKDSRSLLHKHMKPKANGGQVGNLKVKCHHHLSVAPMEAGYRQQLMRQQCPNWFTTCETNKEIFIYPHCSNRQTFTGMQAEKDHWKRKMGWA